MAEQPHTPNAARALVSWTRAVLAAISQLVNDPALLQATRRELNLPPSPANAPDTAAINQKLAEMDEKLNQLDARNDENFALDESTIELLVGGKRIVELVRMIFDEHSPNATDIAYAFATLIASEQLRHHVPLAYVALRLLMFGYERVEDLPRLDPFFIFDRLTGHATRTATPGFGAVEALGGIIVPVAVIAINELINILEHTNVELEALPNGTPYLQGDVDFKLGWEPAPGLPAGLQESLARALTLDFSVTMKIKGREDESRLGLVVTFVALAAEDGGPGFLIRGGGEGQFKLELPGEAKGAIKRSLELKAAGGPGADYLWNTETGDFDFLGSSSSKPILELVFKNEGTDAVPSIRIGQAGKSRLDIGSVGLGWSIGPDARFGFIEFKRGELVIRFADLIPSVEGFFKSIGAEQIGGRVDGKLKLDSRQGLVFEGEAALKVRLASSASIGGAVRIDYLDLELGAATGGGFALGLATAARFKIGLFTGSVDRTGFAAVFRQQGGKITIGYDFKPPKGIGLKFDFPFASGGGFLLLDHDKGEFAGAFDITIGTFSMNAIVILTTKAPGGGSSYALFLMANFRFPGGLEIFLRLTLNAIGFILAFHHGFDRQALERALPSGAMDDVLFPDDPVGDAPRIINSLRTIFPIKPEALTFGFMLEVGWGSDQLCSLRVGLILPIENVLGGDQDIKLQSVVLLGRMAVVCFKGVPKPIRLQLICDFVGEVSFDPFSVRFYARLRDSRYGPIAIEGAIVVSMRTGAESRLLIAAGGFHPNYKQVPCDLPAPIDRIGATYNIGIVKAWVRTYLAIAPGTVQFGAELGIRYIFGPISLGGEFGFDALINLPPAFRFEATVYGGIAVRFRNHEIAGVHMQLTLWGPQRWRAKGRAEFTFLFADIPIHFDESWGSEVQLERERTDVARLVREDLKESSNWRLELPRGASPLITFAKTAGGNGPRAAHPLSILSFTQHRVPFGLQLQRYGSAAIEGPSLFPVPRLTDDHDRPLGSATVLNEQFPISEYLDLSEEDRLSRPSFQPMPAGIATSTEGYVTSDDALINKIELEYEVVFRDTEDRLLVHAFPSVGRDMVVHLAAGEAAGRSEMRRDFKLTDRTLEPVVTKTPDWAVADAATLKPDVTVSAPDWSKGAASLVSILHEAHARRLTVVEDFELTRIS